MKHISFYLSILCTGFLLILTACENGVVSDDDLITRREQKYKNLGKFLGDDTFLFSPEKKKGQANGIGVNSFLWRATLDVLSFMPLRSVDPFGGVVLTEWATLGVPTERVKVDVRILSQDLRADGLKLSVFRETFINGHWINATTSPETVEALENQILTKARQIKVDEGK